MHDHHGHGSVTGGRTLLFSLLLTLAVAVVEAGAGWWSGSLALMGDAGHMLSDSIALGLAAMATVIARRPPSHLHSYGLGRIEVVAALINGLLMLAIVTGIFIEALDRMQSPQPVQGGIVLIVAGAGLLVNLLIAFTLSHSEQTLNIRGALLHVFGDILGSIAALVSGGIIYFGGWLVVDPILSLLICLLILVSSVRLLREAMHVLMEGVPLHIDLPEVGTAIAAVDDAIVSVHDLHIWTLSSGHIALSAHVVIKDLSCWDSVLSRIQETLSHRYGIGHVTLQPEIHGNGNLSVVRLDMLRGPHSDSGSDS